MLKCSTVESKTVLKLEREEENDKKSIGSWVTLPTGQCGQLPGVIKFSKFSS
jgi:hypothetical protein